jgi:hypothetical protein
METASTSDYDKETNCCLVLCFEERDNIKDYSSIDTRLFVTYDFIKKSYVVYGKRIDVVSVSKSKQVTNFIPYFLRCDCINELYNFIEFTIGQLFSITLYNYNNMPYNVEKVDFEFMNNNMNKRYEISAYDNVDLDEKSLKKNIKMLKYMYNF